MLVPSLTLLVTKAPVWMPTLLVSLPLDRPALRRFSEPNNLLQPRTQMFLSNSGADGGNDEEAFNFQAIERALKKGMMKAPLGPPLPISARRVSLPVLPATGPQTNAAANRDPFLSLKDDKEESQEESIYVECEPSTASLPCRAFPTPPARPLKKLKPKISPPGAQQILTENSPDGSCPKSGSLPEDCGMQNKAWYAGRCDRHTAEAALLHYNKDSAYLVRRSSRHGWNQPFTLAVLYKSHVYNIPIRYIESSHQYTLGKDGKSHEELFDSVASIIQNYTEHPLVLIDGSTSAKEQTCLVFPVKP
ncbi:SH2 domain-containing protein 6 [Sceloporus undulatus]|uniref:SH2 domain-containing protein 6 n=1 Tax=Sceloporus undulatus TaxID=8520 RepID=UPI001C4D027B|nr:SH2 domain-containing protein 6 [Sceloporus undulatus]